MPDEEKKNPEVEPSSEEVAETTPVVEEAKPVEAPAVVAEEKAPEAVPATPTPVAASSAGVLVLQWLTYAFWGWLILGLIWLMTIVLVNAILDEPVTGMVPYAIAASIVLLPLAFFTDRMYSKQEPPKKAGGEAVIMIVHAVLFAILGILALIITVFTSINLTISINGAASNDAQLVFLMVTGFSALLWAGAFLRTLNPFHSKKPNRIYSLSMLGLTILLLALALVGPLAKSFATRTDRLIEQNLPSIETSIDAYAQQNNKLPDSLKDLSLDARETTKLIDDGLVEYKKEPTVTKKNLVTGSTTTAYRYQLCVEYSQATKNRSGYSSLYKKEYQSYISTSSHGKGKECYKLESSVTDYTKTTDKEDVDVKVENL